MTDSETRIDTSKPGDFYVRCERTGIVVAGPFTSYGEAYGRAALNAERFTQVYEVIRPERDERGVRLYVADVEAQVWP